MLGRWTLALVIGAMCVACDGESGTDAGTRDSGSDSGGGGTDSGTPTDSGTDSGTTGDDGGGGSCTTPFPALAFEDVAPGFDWGSDCPRTDGSTECLPVHLAQPVGSDDLYVVTQKGFVFIVRDGAVLPTPFINWTAAADWNNSENERGLLGLAFHPDYATNGRFFMYYTSNEGGQYRNVLGEFARSAGDPDVANPTEVRRLIDVRDPYWNHNGGGLLFGPDGYLYVTMGDGGAGGDPQGNGQDTGAMLGKLHRLDVDNAAGGFAAPGNPFEGGGGLPQIWAYGLRNPWRFSFDRSTHDLWIADVGQDEWEEIDFQPASSSGGENYGWRGFEGLTVYDSGDAASITNHTEPVHVFRHNSDSVLPGACSVTGGFVYRGSAIPALGGWYLFADFCSASPAALRRCDGEIRDVQSVPDLNVAGGGFGLFSSFAEDRAGELYLIGFDYVVRIIPG